MQAYIPPIVRIRIRHGKRCIRQYAPVSTGLSRMSTEAEWNTDGMHMWFRVCTQINMHILDIVVRQTARRCDAVRCNADLIYLVIPALAEDVLLLYTCSILADYEELFIIANLQYSGSCSRTRAYYTVSTRYAPRSLRNPLRPCP